MKISVIIPTYKPQAYLWECLDSVVAQTFPKEDFELILVLNGCTEPWKSQIQEYINSKMNGMNVKFIHTEQSGVSNARNLALDVAEGEYIAFVDDDDLISPNYLAGLYDLSDNETVALSNAYAFNDGVLDIKIPYVISDAYEHYSCLGKVKSSKVRKYFSGPCMKLINMSFIQGRRFDIRFKNGEDSLFMFLISDRIKWVNFSSSDAIYYRRYRENSAVTCKKSMKYILTNGLMLISAYSRIYFSNPFKYSLRRYFYVILGTIHNMYVSILSCTDIGRHIL